MKTEYNCLIEKETWNLSKTPSNRNIIPDQLVFKLEKNSDSNVFKYKTR